MATDLDYVGELLERLTDRVGTETAVIGFAGGPFTLASYAVAGEPTRSHVPVRRLRARHPEAFDDLLAQFADVVQLFDTYAGVLSPADYERFVLPYHREILDGLSVPSIVFVRWMGGRLDQLARTGADVVGLDWTVETDAAREALGDRPVQENLDPAALFAPPETVRERTRAVIERAGPAGHVLNLGHGVDKDTPVESVEAAKAVDR